jgi:peptidoglycan/xylan/chitin deacetylase (PgdA/CDA1 family)
VTHRPLTLLADHELGDELKQGRATLRAATGEAVDLFSYPDGACDARVTAAVQAAGYCAAVLAGEGAGGQRYRLPRVFRCPV